MSGETEGEAQASSSDPSSREPNSGEPGHDRQAEPTHERVRELERNVRHLEVLLKETHHRVKNNLQVIASLVAILASSEEQVPAWVDSLEHRIRAISLIHETIYTSSSYGHVDLGEYIERMVDHVLTSSTVGAKVAVNLDIASRKMGIAEIMPLGIILSEFLLNSVKHAFEVRGSGELHIREHEAEDGTVTLEYRDDGPGMQAELLSGADEATPASEDESGGAGDGESSRESAGASERGSAPGAGSASKPDTASGRDTPSVGMEIVHALIAQLDGNLEIGEPPGFSAVLTFPRRSRT
jgi:two-component sensor histidine kinase